MKLSNKTILLISPQSWGKMFISKHHYALELAKRGNKVYYLNPPELANTPVGSISIVPSGVHENLFLINHRLFFPYILKFHALPVFHVFMRLHMKRILKKVDPPDIIWSFDLGNLYPLYFFRKRITKVFHPVDEPSTKPSIDAVVGADILFSVTQEIIEKYAAYPIPKYFVNHGVAEEFLHWPAEANRQEAGVRIGFSGNMLRNDIDRPVLLQIMQENPHVRFDIWGSYTVTQNNIGGSNNDDRTADFINALKGLSNVVLHGPVSTADLAKAFREVDAFLICYDVHTDQSKGTNYHKILEFLSAGKIIISNNVTTYKNRPDLIQMVEERDNNDRLPALFRQVVDNLAIHNSPELQQGRRQFAADNAYARQLDRIEQLMATHLKQFQH